MSVISGFHTAELYTGKNRPADETQRLCVLTFKTEKKKSEKELDGKPNPTYDPSYKRPEARCVSIPKLFVHITPDLLKDAMQQAFEELQDAVIRKLLLEKLEADEKIINFHDDQIGFNAVAAYAAETAANGKLTRELIGEWFDADLADALTLKLADAMKLPEKPTSDDEKRLAAAVTNYRSSFMTLAAPKSGMSPKIAKQMQRALEQCSNQEDRVYKALNAKVVAHLELKEPDLIGL